MTKVDYSETESSVLGLQIGRCNSDEPFDTGELYRQIVEGRYDVCRLKTPAEDEMVSYRLNQMGLPFFFSGSIRRYKTPVAEVPPGEFRHPDVTFEPYDGTQNELLRDMLVGTWGTYPIGYYRSPYLGSLVNKEQEIESVFRFYKKQNNPNEYPQNGFMFVRHGDRYVGFFATNKVGNSLESHVGGILAPYRKEGYFLDKLAYIKHYCKTQGLEYFAFGARNENAEVQRIFQFAGFRPTGTENVFHISAFLGYGQKTAVLRTPDRPFGSFDEWYTYLQQECLSVGRQVFPHVGRVSFQLNHAGVSFPAQEMGPIRISVPVATPEEALVVVQGANGGPLTGYCRLAT